MLVHEKKFDVQETARLANVSPLTIRRKLKTGELRCYRIGRRVLVGEHHLAEFLTRCESEAGR
jgi:excisionase family DNA binding protein